MELPYETYQGSWSTPRSRQYVQIAAAYVNTAIRTAPTTAEMEGHWQNIDAVTARAFAAMTNMAFAAEVALKKNISDDVLKKLKHEHKAHDLKALFDCLSRDDHEQIRLCVNDILCIDDDLFDALLHLCKDGFVDWRYFFEEKNLGKSYPYDMIIGFLYALTYVILEGDSGGERHLENTPWKEKAYIGNTGLMQIWKAKNNELISAIKTALDDGNGVISETDETWIDGIRQELKKIDQQIEDAYAHYQDMTCKKSL